MHFKNKNDLAWLVQFTCAVAVCLAFAPCSAAAQEGAGNLPLGQGGRLWNISDAPFKYRLRRTGGEIWTAVKTLAPGKYQRIQLPKPGEQAELEGLDVRDPHLSIEYPELGGLMRFRLPARSSSGTIVPFWFYVKDSNGFGRLIQAAGLGEAQAEQARLQKAPPVKPEQLEALKATLQANWVYYPNRPMSESASSSEPSFRRWGGCCHCCCQP
jgi:hypothetical protein